MICQILRTATEHAWIGSWIGSWRAPPLCSQIIQCSTHGFLLLLFLYNELMVFYQARPHVHIVVRSLLPPPITQTEGKFYT